MDYAEAQEKLAEYMNLWKPEGEAAEMLETAATALEQTKTTQAMFSDLYLATYDIHDGEDGYTDYDFIHAGDIDEAAQKANNRLSQWWGEFTVNRGSYYEHKQGYPNICLDYIEKIDDLARIIFRIGEIK